MFEFKGFVVAAFVTCFVFGNINAQQGGTVYKTVIKEGTGPIARPNQTVVVHYTGTLQNGVKIDSSYDRNEPFKFQLGAGEVIRGWDAGVSSMKVGERAKLEIAPEDAYGPEGMPGVIPPNSTLTFDIELLAVEDTPGVQTAPPFSDIQSAAGGFQTFNPPPLPQPAQQPQRQPTASLFFPGQQMMPGQGMMQPAGPPREPNIQNLIASNNAFISEPSSFTGQFSGVVPQGGTNVFGDRAMAQPGQGFMGTQAAQPGATGQMMQNGFGSQTFQQPQAPAPAQQGPIARPNQTVVVHYTGTLQNGVKIDSSYDRNEPFKFQLGAGEVIRGWDAGVSSMKVGERAKLEIAPEDAYGPEGMPGVIPPNSTLTFDIELLAVEDTPGVQTAPPFSDIQSAAGGFQTFNPPPLPQPAQQPQRQPTASLFFPGQQMMPGQGMMQPAGPPREPNIQNLIASNNAFISEPSSFTGQFSGVVPQGGTNVFGDRAMAQPGQGFMGTQAAQPGATGQMMQNGFGSQTFQQPQAPAPAQQGTGTFFPISQTRGASSFTPPGTQGAQFGFQGRPHASAPSMAQPGMPGGAQMFNGMQQATGTATGFGVTREPTFQVDPRQMGTGGTPFRTGNTQQPMNGRTAPSGTPDRATMQAMQERMMAARRMGMMPTGTGGRGFSGPGRAPPTMADMLARMRMGMPGGPAGMRAMMAMRGGMRPGAGPMGPMGPGFPRPRISPFMARRMFRRRRI